MPIWSPHCLAYRYADAEIAREDYECVLRELAGTSVSAYRLQLASSLDDDLSTCPHIVALAVLLEQDETQAEAIHMRGTVITLPSDMETQLLLRAVELAPSEVGRVVRIRHGAGTWVDSSTGHRVKRPQG